MRLACEEARKWLGATPPNPPVGAVALDGNGNVLAIAAHRKAGQSHAEAELIERCAADGTLGAIETLCVTLEPCTHHGLTPPCADKIVASGIKRIAIGARDPNPYVRGGGTEMLRKAGIEVIERIEEEECKQLIHAFACAVTTGKPWITVKQAFTRAGSMTPPIGHKTFTSKESLTLAHRLRKKAGAILTGSGTILADTPHFTVRNIPDFPEPPGRTLAILDRRKRVPPDYLQTASKNGFTTLVYDDLDEAFTDLARRGIQDILVEAGPALSQAVLNSGHWTMRVEIRQNDKDKGPDIWAAQFNPSAQTPFAPDRFQWEWLLPA